MFKTPYYILVTSPFILRLILAVSFLDLQALPSTTIPQACQSAYDTEIPNCDSGDFQEGECTADCLSGLQATAETVASACSGVSVKNDTLLGEVIQGTVTQGWK